MAVVDRLVILVTREMQEIVVLKEHLVEKEKKVLPDWLVLKGTAVQVVGLVQKVIEVFLVWLVLLENKERLVKKDLLVQRAKLEKMVSTV